MTTALSRTRPTKPAVASVHALTVRAAERLSPGFARVTLGSDDPGLVGEYAAVGFDQWFRLFLPGPDGGLVLPSGPIEGWYGRWQAIPEERRPVVRNYTVREARRVEGHCGAWELDVDFVVHRSATTGRVEGAAAGWALEAVAGERVGEQVGLLDQGRIFAAEDHPGPVLVVADETGLPGVEGIARDLGARGRDDVTYLLEVPDRADRRDLPAAARARTTWVVRSPHDRAGDGLLRLLAGREIDPATSVYAVGESRLALGVRERARAAGVPDDLVDFCAYWRAGRRR